jgi:hypothetical protein
MYVRTSRTAITSCFYVRLRQHGLLGTRLVRVFLSLYSPMCTSTYIQKITTMPHYATPHTRWPQDDRRVRRRNEPSLSQGCARQLLPWIFIYIPMWNLCGFPIFIYILMWKLCGIYVSEWFPSTCDKLHYYFYHYSFWSTILYICLRDLGGIDLQYFTSFKGSRWDWSFLQGPGGIPFVYDFCCCESLEACDLCLAAEQDSFQSWWLWFSFVRSKVSFVLSKVSFVRSKVFIFAIWKKEQSLFYDLIVLETLTNTLKAKIRAF